MPPRSPATSVCRFCAARPLGLCQPMKTDDDLNALQGLQYRIRSYGPGKLIFGPHEPNGHVYNVISGWLAISHDLLDGQRQISQFLTKGAFFGFRPDGLNGTGQSAIAIDEVTVCAIPAANLSALVEKHPNINRRLIWMLGREALITANRLAFVGQTSAITRIANLLLELTIMATGQKNHTNGTQVRLPLTQAQIADATGLTAIHVNRMLRRLREEKVLDMHDGFLNIFDIDSLQTLAQLGDEISDAWLTH
jgi:CRP/FNR family transcriptional regulator